MAVNAQNSQQSSRRRDLVVAGIAVAVLGAVAWLALDLLGSREEPPPPDPATAAEQFAQAWLERDVDAFNRILVRRPGEDLTDALAAFDPLEPADFRVTVGEVTVDPDEDGFATVTLVPELDLPDVGTWTWTSELAMERGRGTWRVRWDFTSFHPSLADGLHFETRLGPPQRAPILGNDGTPLTATGEVVTIGVEPGRVPSPERLAETLATLVPEAVEPLQETFARADLVPTWFYPLVTVPAERLAGIRGRIETLPGMILRSTDGRIGGTEAFGRHLLGRVVDADEELAAEREVEVGTPVGTDGLERAFDDFLRGSEVTEVVAVEPDGDVRASVASFADDVAASVRTTLDPLVQEAIENALVGQQGRIGVVAVGTDGGVRGSASRPLTGYNRAFAGNYPPGASVWALPLLAAVDGGLDDGSPIECPSVARVGGVAFENLTGFDLGTVSVVEAVANGCRSSIARLAGDLPAGTLRALALQLGFDQAPRVVMESVRPQWPAANDVAERAASGVGQHTVLAPVVHLASVAAAFLDGTWDLPHVLMDDRDEPGDPLPPGALAETLAILESAGARAALPRGTGLVAGEGTSPEGNLGWVMLTSRSEEFGDFGAVVLVEQGTRAQALTIAERFLAELRELRERG